MYKHVFSWDGDLPVVFGCGFIFQKMFLNENIRISVITKRCVDFMNGFFKVIYRTDPQ